MKHPLVPSIEILGALPLGQLNEQSIYGSDVDPITQLDAHDRVNARRYQQAPPTQVLYVDRLPRRHNSPDRNIKVGYIGAWASSTGVAQGVLLENLDDAVELCRLAMRGVHSTHPSLYRAASIAKWNDDSESDGRSIVVDAAALDWRPGARIQWEPPMEVNPVKKP